MGREATLLVTKIRKLGSLFRSNGIDHCADWLEEDARLISSGDLEGIDHLLSAYGGMGSMSDVFISRQVSDPIEDRATSRVNSEICGLRASIYELAASIRRKKR